MDLVASRFKALLKSLLTGAPCQNSAKALMEHLTSLCERDKRYVKLFSTEGNQLDITETKLHERSKQT